MDKKDRPYRVVEYDPNWVIQFNNERENLQKAFGQTALDIQHIGSTSIPDIWAKPQIDILITTPSLEEVDKVKNNIENAGYTHEVDFDKFNTRVFYKAKESEERLVTVHVLAIDDPRAKQYIHFREYLCSHPEERDLYSKAKRDSFNEGKTDRVAYSAGKKAVLTQLLERAAKWNNEQF